MTPNCPSFLHFNGFVTRLIRRVPLVEQELFSFRSTCVHPGYRLLEHLSSLPGFSGVRVTRSFSFRCMFCRSLFVLLYFFFCRSLFVLLFFFFCPLCCLFFNLQILITPLVSSNSSFVDRCLSFCTFSVGHCVVCFSIYRF
jgi:hypothetical protein